MTPEFARYAFTAIVTILGTGLCVFVFLGLAALGNMIRFNSRRMDEYPVNRKSWENEE